MAFVVGIVVVAFAFAFVVVVFGSKPSFLAPDFIFESYFTFRNVVSRDRRVSRNLGFASVVGIVVVVVVVVVAFDIVFAIVVSLFSGSGLPSWPLLLFLKIILSIP